MQGATKVAAASGVCSSALAALLAARILAPGWGQRLARPWSGVTKTITADWARGGYLGQFITYLLCIAMAGGAAVVWSLAWRLVVSRTSERVGVYVAAAAALGAVAWAFAVSALLGVLAAATWVVATWLTADTTVSPTVPTPSSSSKVSLTVVLSEALATIWGLWL